MLPSSIAEMLSVEHQMYMTNWWLSVAEVPALHAALKPLEWLVGCWKATDGLGHYPTIKDFRYMEEIEFFHVGQPILQFTQVHLLFCQCVQTPKPDFYACQQN